MTESPEPRTYSGRVALLVIVGAVAAVFVALNLLGKAAAPEPERTPPPAVVTSVTPTG